MTKQNVNIQKSSKNPLASKQAPKTLTPTARSILDIVSRTVCLKRKGQQLFPLNLANMVRDNCTAAIFNIELFLL